MEKYQLEILRASALLTSVEIDESTVYNGEFMGMDKVEASFIVDSALPIQLDDYIEYVINNEPISYKIKQAIDLDQIDGKTFKYGVTFFSPIYDMYDVLIMHLGRVKFNYTGTPLELLGLIVDCLNAEQPGWSIGDCSLISEAQSFTFDGQSCRTALTTVAEAFKLEYKVIGKAFYLVEKIGSLQDITLKYGRGQGLTKASRQAVDQSFATVWYGFGGSKNLPEGYRDGMDRLALDAPILVNVDKYGRKQGSVIFEDCYPRRTSTITSVVSLNEVIDDTLDFDLNVQTITDGGAKIVFKSGELSGQEFVITSYNPNTKTIRFGFNKDDTGYIQPNDTFSPALGDKYTLTGIVMPQTYIDAAHAELSGLLAAHAAKNSFPPVAFPLNIDEKYIREMGLVGKLTPGDSLNVISESLGVNTHLRLQSVSWPLVNPWLITGVVSDVVQYTTQEKIIKDVKQGKKEISKTIAVALNTRQVADEIANAAIMEQFKRTYVGDRAILTGAFVAGNPEAGEVAGINGTDNLPESVRIWSGSSFENKENAPFRVQQNGKAFATALEVRDGCKIGNFSIDGGVLKSSDYSGSGTSGMWISDDGIVSRNAKASLIPSSTGIIIEASFFGETSKNPVEIPNLFPSPISAGVIGIRRQELNTAALDNTTFCRGSYGMFVSSFKNIGAEFKAVRWSSSGSGDEPMTLGDYLLIVQDSRSGVILPEAPDKGMMVEIKNARGTNISVNRAGSDSIIDTTNTLVNSITLSTGQRIRLIYLANGSRWLVL